MPRYVKLLLLALFVVTFAAPLIAYWLVIGRAPSVTPEEARREIVGDPTGTVLVDIRGPAAYARERIAASENWPWEDLQGVKSSRDIPARFHGKRLLLFCQNGVLSASAVRKLRSLGATDAYAVRDGMCGWIASETGCSGAGDSACRLIHPRGSQPEPTMRISPQFEQDAALLSGFVIKPLYMLLALVLIVWLWRSASPDLTALRWSMIVFLAGEANCAVNYVLFNHQSHLGEYLHSAGMVVSFALAAFAGLMAADLRLIHFRDESRPCAFAQLCGPCAKHADAPCGLRQMLMLSAGGLMAVALLPFCVQPHTACYNTALFAVPYTYAHPVIYQIFETRFCPSYALLFLGGSLLALLFQRRAGLALAEVLLAAGLGALGFGMFRLLLFAAFRDNLVWSVFWEEVLELLTVVSAAVLLRVFRAGLFRRVTEPLG